MTTKLLKRKQIRLQAEAYSNASRAFSITICTYQKKPFFNNDELIKAVFDSFTDHVLSHANCYAAVLMIDHMHLLLSADGTNLIDLLRDWKSYTTRISWNYGIKGQLWQKGFYDHAIRGEKHLYEAALYIVENPVRAGIVKNYHNYAYYYHGW